MAANDPFGFEPEDVDRLLRSAGDQLRGAFGQLGNLFDRNGGGAGWSTFLDDVGRAPRRVREPETTGATGDGVWAVYLVDASGSAQIEQIYATEIDALRANQHNTDGRRAVRFLPYGMPVTVLDSQVEPLDG